MPLDIYDSRKGLDFVTHKTSHYLVFSFKHNGFWCADFLGTTDRLDEAAAFPKQIAVDHVRQANAALPGLDMAELAVPEALFIEPDYRTRVV